MDWQAEKARMLADFDSADARARALFPRIPPESSGFAPSGDEWTIGHICHHFVAGLSLNLLMQQAGRAHVPVPAPALAAFYEAGKAARNAPIDVLAAHYVWEAERFRFALQQLRQHEIEAEYTMRYPSGKEYPESTIKTIDIGIAHVVEHVEQIEAWLAKRARA